METQKRRTDSESSISGPQTVLITGGSSGIGWELAKLFAADGYQIVIVSLRKEELEYAKEELSRQFGVLVAILQKDLSMPDSARQVYEFVCQQNLHVDILVNNAGFGSFGAFQETSLDHEYKMLLLNCGATMALTKFFYPRMVEKGQGKILNIASTVGLQPTPNMAAYSGSKAFIKYFSLALSDEAKKNGVTVTTVYPYATRTNFDQAANMTGHRLFENPFTQEPDTVAKAAYKAMLKGKLQVFLPRGSWLVFGFLYRFLTQRGKMRLVKWGMRSG